MGRRLGQHFLSDPTILDRIVDALSPALEDTVLEVGAGKGTLTRRLAPRAGEVIAIEKDRALARVLRGETGKGKGEGYAPLPSNVRVIEGDALELDWHQLLTGAPFPVSPFPFPRSFKVIGNIPYYISSPLIEKALTLPSPAVIVFLVQREVADRLAAKPGGRTYGALSVGVQVAAVVERLFVVPAGAFRPPPKVDSAVVRLVPRKQPLVDHEDHAEFRRLVTALFGQRRKQLSRIIRSVERLEKQATIKLPESIGLDPAARPEVLSPQELVQLFHSLPLRNR